MTRWGLACVLFFSASTLSAAGVRFALAVEQSGVHRVDYADLLRARPDLGEHNSRRIGLRNAGEPVAIQIVDGGDGVFGAGDSILFRADRLHGPTTWFHPYSDRNVYVLDFNEPAPKRFVQAEPASGDTQEPVLIRHFEEDVLLLRFSGAGSEADAEQWFWAKLSHADPKPFRIKLDLPGLRRGGQDPVRIRVALKGWSRPGRGNGDLKDHRVEVLLGGRVVAAPEWNNAQEPGTFEIPGLTAADFATSPLLEFRVPTRRGADRNPVVDVVVINWIEASYAWDGQLLGGQVRLQSPANATALRLPQPADAGRRWTAFSDAGTRLEIASGGQALAATSIDLVTDDGFLAPTTVRALPDDRLRDPRLQGDYLVITAAALAPDIEPLVAYHRRQGLSVVVATIDEVYDQFGHGIADPRAIKAFLAHAASAWRAPAPRFVLLVGDASWDIRSDRPDASQYPDMAYQPMHGTAFARVESTPYAGRTAHRNLIPTWSYGTYDGHAAGDNWFVALGEGDKPSMAIGRFPVVEPEELRAIVQKTLRYLTSPPEGDWRKRVLWIANEEPSFQAWSSDLAEWLQGLGFAGEKFFPHPDATRDPQVQEPAKLREELDRGNLLVHFVGHGGRFIWRTGPADWTKHRDLFGLGDIDQLLPTERLPVVLSMTCYSAPFDHPTADSIGEKLLREPGRGAVAVIAASWRNAPHRGMSEGLLKEILAAPTLGEALQRAKSVSGDRDFREQYNLLGDPALVLPLAAHQP